MNNQRKEEFRENENSKNNKTFKTFIIYTIVSLIISFGSAFFYLKESQKQLSEFFNITFKQNRSEKAYPSPSEKKNNLPTKLYSPPPKNTQEHQKEFIYSWVDENDIKHFSDSPPLETVKEYSATPKLNTYLTKFPFPPKTKASQSNPLESETNVIIKGNSVLVPVTIGHKGKKFSTYLVIDTGAETTVLHKSVADKLNIASTKTIKAKVADGRFVDSKIAYLDYLVIGRNVMENVEVLIIKQETKSEIGQGLLGMNFLKGWNFTIDFNRKVVKWNYKIAKNE